jgi:hypothetical protein
MERKEAEPRIWKHSLTCSESQTCAFANAGLVMSGPIPFSLSVNLELTFLELFCTDNPFGSQTVGLVLMSYLNGIARCNCKCIAPKTST